METIIKRLKQQKDKEEKEGGTIEELIKKLGDKAFNELKELKIQEEILLKKKKLIRQELDKIYIKSRDVANPMFGLVQAFRERCYENDMTELIT